jgi:hypothetical protein
LDRSPGGQEERGRYPGAFTFFRLSHSAIHRHCGLASRWPLIQLADFRLTIAASALEYTPDRKPRVLSRLVQASRNASTAVAQRPLARL